MLPRPRSESTTTSASVPAPATGESREHLYIGERLQWVSTTQGRIAGDGFSWLQAVHWVNDTKVYRPKRAHGPKWGPTTMQVAQLLADLSPCRPGIEYLMRRTRLKERAVQYHLQMLREAGLLVYVVKGTRVRGEQAQASEFAWTVPVQYDQAAGIRTLGTGPQRRMIGIADSGRTLIAKLGKKAARKVRRPLRKKSETISNRATPAPRRCTPMQGRTSRSSTAAITGFPPESKLEDGTSTHSTPTTPKKPARLNAVGRRYQLAREIVEQLPWLGRASVPRIAWIVRDVADAGWTTAEVIAVVGQDAPARHVRRPSGFLAHRLRGAHLLYDTPTKRQRILSWWRDSKSAEQARHVEWEGTWQPPRSRSVARLVGEALDAARPQPLPAQELPAIDGIEGLSKDEITDLRRTAGYEYLSGRTTLVTSAVSLLGRPAAEQLYGTTLVDRVLRLAAAGSRLRAVGRR